jgi:two-component system response regulator HydG
MKNILVTAIGTSPQIVTETWQKLTVEDNIVIDEILTFHTTDSKVITAINELKEQLPIKKVKFTPISLEFVDILGPKENSQFTNIIFSELWKRRLHDESLYVSIAGGRKTISALLYWIAELVGAKSITHVLTSAEVEHSKDFFPSPEKLNLVKLFAIDLFPSIIHLCNVNKIDTNKPEKVWAVIQNLPSILPGLMENAVKEVFPTTEDGVDFEGLRELKEKVKREINIAPTAHILILGETGVGKEYLVRFINRITQKSKGTARQLITTNCAVVSQQLAASELFGHKKGAFTGAINDKKGKIELARDGDFFLDEIGDLPVEVQTQLLRLMQFGEYEPIGAEKSEKINVRLIAATNKSISVLRDDLKYRFTYIYTIKPIRERPEDIKKYVNSFFKQQNESMDKGAMALLLKYDWPGNFRQLRNVLSRASANRSNSSLVTIEDIKKAIEESQSLYQPNFLPKDDEKTRIEKALKESKWNVAKAAKKLNKSKSTLYNKIKEYRISKFQQ